MKIVKEYYEIFMLLFTKKILHQSYVSDDNRSTLCMTA